MIEDEVAKTGLDALMREYADDLVKDVPGGYLLYFSFVVFLVAFRINKSHRSRSRQIC